MIFSFLDHCVASRRTAISHEKGKRFFEYYCGSTYKVVEKNSM